MKILITEYFPGLNFKPYYHVSWGSFLENGNWRQLESTHRLNYLCIPQALSSNSPLQPHAYLATLRFLFLLLLFVLDSTSFFLLHVLFPAVSSAFPSNLCTTDSSHDSDLSLEGFLTIQSKKSLPHITLS